MIMHDLVERTLRGTPRFVARRGRGHSRPEGGHRASEEPDQIGLNSRAGERPVADFAVLRLWRDRRSCATRNDAVLHAANVSLLEERVAKSPGEAASPRAMDAPMAISLPSVGDKYFVSRRLI